MKYGIADSTKEEITMEVSKIIAMSQSVQRRNIPRANKKTRTMLPVEMEMVVVGAGSGIRV